MHPAGRRSAGTRAGRQAQGKGAGALGPAAAAAAAAQEAQGGGGRRPGRAQATPHLEKCL